MRSELERLCDRLGVRAESRFVENDREDWQDATAWSVTLQLEQRELTVPFYMGSALTGEPTPADVVSSLVLDARCGELTFEDFCSEMGYDVDSRKAEATWRECASIAPRIRELLGDHYEELAEAEH